MNRIYRLIWNTTLCCWTVASEHTKGRGKKARTSGAATLAVALTLALPAQAAEPVVPIEEEERREVVQPFALAPMPFAFASRTVSGAIGVLAVHRQLALVSDSSYRDATITGDYSIVLGSRASMNGYNSAGYGVGVTVNGNVATAIGAWSKAINMGATALGASSEATGINASAVGYAAKATGQGAAALGEVTKATGGKSVAVGSWSESSGASSIAMGYSARAQSDQTLALGTSATANGHGAIAMGNKASALSRGGVAIGDEAAVSTGGGVQAIAIGGKARAGSEGWTGAVSLGGESASRYDGVALGYYASAEANGSVALGRASIATEANTVSVGNATTKRRIVNVADARLSATSTDAATGKQLFDTNTRLAAATGQLNGTSTAIGRDAEARSSYDTAIGNAAKASGSYSNAIGYSATSAGANAVAIGTLAAATSHSAVSVGNRAGVDATSAYGVAMGYNAKVNANAASGTALGTSAAANAAGSVALGASSVATVANTVSVGSASLKRKIVNVADAALTATSSEAVTGKQLSTTNQNVTTATTTANTAKTAADAARVDAASALTKANLVGGLISQAAPDGTVRVGVQNAGTRLDVRNSANANRTLTGLLDGAVSASSTEAVTGKQLFATNQNVTTALTKANLVSGLVSQAAPDGTVRMGVENTGALLDVRNKSNANRRITGVADGALSTISTEAVTGKQLFTTNQSVAVATSTANAAKTTADAAQVVGTSALDKANVLGGLVSQVSATGNVRLGGENTGTVLDVRNKSNANRRISGVADATLSTTSNEAVTGKQLNQTNANVATAASTANTALTNTTTLGGLISQGSVSGSVRLGGENTGSLIDVRNKADAARKLSGVADATLSATSTEAVTGKQLNTTNQNVATAAATANTALASATALGGLVSQVSASGNVRLGGENTGTLIDVRNKSNASRTLSGVADGALSITSTEAVSGKQLNATNQNVTAAATAANTAKTTAEAAHALATSAQDTATLTAGLVGQVSPSGAVRLGAENTGSLLDVRNKNNAARTISGLADGAVSGNSSEAVTGRQLFATNASVASNAQSIADNLGNIDDNRSSIGSNRDGIAGNSRGIGTNRDDIASLRSDFDAYVPDLEGAVKFSDDRLIVDLEGARLTGIRDGDISSATSSDAVSGGQLFATNERVNYLADQQQYVAVGSHEYSEGATAAWLGVAVGDSADASAEGALALGSYAIASGISSVALGRGAYVDARGNEGFALGTATRVSADSGMAIGAKSIVEVGAANSVALGNQSVAGEQNVVSMGNDNLKRRLVNVARGKNSDDATTIEQLSGVLTGLGGGAGLDLAGIVVAPNYGVQGENYSNVGDALGALDSAVFSARGDVDSLDRRIKGLFQEELDERADGAGRLNLGGANGMVLGNVANGLIASGSRDAVNGGQLYEVRKDLQSQIDNLEGQGNDVAARMGRMGAPVAMSSEAPAVAVQGDVASASEAHANPVANVDTPEPVVKAEGDNAVAVGSEGKERSVKHVAKGSADTDAVNVAQLNDVLDRATEYTDIAVEGLNKRLDGMDKRFNRMAAMGSAQSAMAMNTAGLNTYNRLGAGVGHSDGESALAVGYQRVMNERGSATFSLNGAFTNSGEKTVGVGVGIGW